MDRGKDTVALDLAELHLVIDALDEVIENDLMLTPWRPLEVQAAEQLLRRLARAWNDVPQEARVEAIYALNKGLVHG